MNHEQNCWRIDHVGNYQETHGLGIYCRLSQGDPSSQLKEATKQPGWWTHELTIKVQVEEGFPSIEQRKTKKRCFWKTCMPLLQDAFARHSSWTFLYDTVAWHACGLAEHSCKALFQDAFWDTLAWHAGLTLLLVSCKTLLLVTLAEYSCKTCV